MAQPKSWKTRSSFLGWAPFFNISGAAWRMVAARSHCRRRARMIRRGGCSGHSGNAGSIPATAFKRSSHPKAPARRVATGTFIAGRLRTRAYRTFAEVGIISRKKWSGEDGRHLPRATRETIVLRWNNAAFGREISRTKWCDCRESPAIEII